MIQLLEFWEAYRRALVQPGYFLDSGSTLWTGWTCCAACAACRELGLDPRTEQINRIDVVAHRDLCSLKEGQLPYAVAYEHEGGIGYWYEELTKLWLFPAELRVLVVYYRGDATEIYSELQLWIRRLQSEQHSDALTNWLFAFGLENSKQFRTTPWNIWTMTANGRLTPVEGATPFFPRIDLHSR